MVQLVGSAESEWPDVPCGLSALAIDPDNQKANVKSTAAPTNSADPQIRRRNGVPSETKSIFPIRILLLFMFDFDYSPGK